MCIIFRLFETMCWKPCVEIIKKKKKLFIHYFGSTVLFIRVAASEICIGMCDLSSCTLTLSHEINQLVFFILVHFSQC